MKIQRQLVVGLVSFGMALSAIAEQTAKVRIVGGKLAGERSVVLEEITDSHYRLTLRKVEIPADAVSIDVVAPFMTAMKGDAGYWVNARGTYGKFDKDEGVFYILAFADADFRFQAWS